MLLVICGAGISFDSASSIHPVESTHTNLQNRPPLASELFSEHFSWVEIFIVVDGMSRDGRVFLRKLGLIDER